MLNFCCIGIFEYIIEYSFCAEGLDQLVYNLEEGPVFSMSDSVIDIESTTNVK